MKKPALNKLLDRADILCSERGVRFTRQRRKVLEIVCETDRPLGAYEILDAMRNVIPRAAPPTVYRALDFLLDQGLVHKLETLHAYIGCNHPEHPHSSLFLICTECGHTNELADDHIVHSLRLATSSSGFVPQRRIVEVIGTCDRCNHPPPSKLPN